MTDTLKATTPALLSWVRTTRPASLAEQFDYNLLRSRSPFGCRDRVVISLSWDGWQIHRVDPRVPFEDGVETACGHGGTRFWVGETEVPEFEPDQLCLWCWTSPDERSRLAEYLPKLWAFTGLEGLSA